MGTQIGKAIFDDGMTKFFVFDTLKNEAFSCLYCEKVEAQKVSFANNLEYDIPPLIGSDKAESVTLFFSLDDKSGRSTCISTYSNEMRTYITGVSSVELYQGKDFAEWLLDG
jgi:hypothetical protein